MVDAPVCDSLMGKGAFDGEDDLYTGMLGMHGTKASNLGVSECDLLIAVGVRFQTVYSAMQRNLQVRQIFYSLMWILRKLIKISRQMHL